MTDLLMTDLLLSADLLITDLLMTDLLMTDPCSSCLLMTASDLSDQTKDWLKTKKIAELVYTEFFTQVLRFRTEHCSVRLDF